jgi:hypothetical protein
MGVRYQVSNRAREHKERVKEQDSENKRVVLCERAFESKRTKEREREREKRERQ